ncbi:MAG: hypothetical protein AAF517_17580, partial [Planctomycetota bacterium]
MGIVDAIENGKTAEPARNDGEVELLKRLSDLVDRLVVVRSNPFLQLNNAQYMRVVHVVQDPLYPTETLS